MKTTWKGKTKALKKKKKNDTSFKEDKTISIKK